MLKTTVYLPVHLTIPADGALAGAARVFERLDPELDVRARTLSIPAPDGPKDLKAALAREAEHRGVAEAELIRAAIAAAIHRPAPRAGLFESDEPFAERVDELLEGFGDR